jgi:hypothetical protein
MHATDPARFITHAFNCYGVRLTLPIQLIATSQPIPHAPCGMSEVLIHRLV